MSTTSDKEAAGLKFIPFFSSATEHPFYQVKWRRVDAIIKDAEGRIVFEQKDVEAPDFWSERAVNIVAEKYFRVVDGLKETSVKQLISRVAHTITAAGVSQKLLTEDSESSEVFEKELIYLLLHQMFSFNSPVWFNIGVPGVRQQASACFINSVEDTMDSITDLAKTEVLLFKGGSGAGSNLSKLRSSYEKLSGGGSPSGPVSFMKMLDAGAGVTKSGGTTRRAALMRVLNVDHPDILEQANGEPGFIRCKAHAEKIAQTLIANGFSSEFNKPGNAYDLVSFQNANNSVRVTDQFMRAVQTSKEWRTYTKSAQVPVHTYLAADLWREIAQAAWECGDPGIQFDTTTNLWHTLPHTGRINASNPCSEFLHLDDTSCNLGSFNLLKFCNEKMEFQYERFAAAVEVCITAMEILVDYAEYPDERIAVRTKNSRPLGIGYANLGAMLMMMGVPYNSDEGRRIASAITSLMTAAGYRQSARMAALRGAFPYWATNAKAMRDVIKQHISAHWEKCSVWTLAGAIWNEALTISEVTGFRNSQISVLAPTGTIGFMMDCDTTGLEPMLGLLQYKKLVGGGFMRIASKVVDAALAARGYSPAIIATIKAELESTGTSSAIRPVDRPVFQTAIGDNPISAEGHLLMMAAVQPFLSGGISKTVNLPESASVEDVADVYMMAWRLGLKCVAIYRDGCKKSQPASTSRVKKGKADDTQPTTAKSFGVLEALSWGQRKRLPDERPSITHKFSIAGQDGYFHVGLHDDGSPGELFIDIAKAGSTLHGLVDMTATAISLGLQYGVPLHMFANKFRGVRFEPSGFTGNEDIPRVDSLADYLAQWLGRRFLKLPAVETPLVDKVEVDATISAEKHHGDPCRSCGNLTLRAGSCWVCPSCGTTTGCG